MDGERFLTGYMQPYCNEYILIGGNACALHFDALDAAFRATVDLDIVLITESANPDFYAHLCHYFQQHGYVGKRFNGSNPGGSAYRFILPVDQRNSGHPLQIELFARKPEYFDVTQANKLYITPIETGEGMSNLSAILLEDDIYDFVSHSRVNLGGVSTVTLACLLGLKSVAWHNNQSLKDDGEDMDMGTILKHPADMMRIVSILEPEETYYPHQVFHSLQLSREKFGDPNVRALLVPLSDGMDFDTTIEFIASYVKLKNTL